MPSVGRGQRVVMVLAAVLSAGAAAPAAMARPVGIARAQSAALAASPGGMVDTTLALDRGRLVYGVEIETAPATLANVEVDAASGRVLRVTTRREPGPFRREIEAP
ncbi:MAG TPA: PepSY domain-containing protein [Methylomirabilota bacterium]|nr:PepSY domain-containing protein [Methylomirabilota bacterium]